MHFCPLCSHTQEGAVTVTLRPNTINTNSAAREPVCAAHYMLVLYS